MAIILNNMETAMKLLNCRGMACPQPVIRSRELVDAGTAELAVLVDNEPAAENVERFLRGRGYSVDRAKEGDGLWRLTARAGEGAAVGANPVRAETASGLGREAGTLVLITTESLGRGDEGLGEKLMTNFLATLPELGSRLWRLVLLNGGVKLAARPGPALEALQSLAQSGVSVLVCGTCLAHYGLLEAKAVGETSNMLDIVTSLDLADKIIRP